MQELKAKLDSLEGKVDRLLERFDTLSLSVERHDNLFHGGRGGGDLGLIDRVDVLWSNHVWVACGASMMAGSLAVVLFIYFWGK